ncbi:capsid assembly scaffolding protein Gp46 family protein [Clostridioides difficile]|uniref:capsid assembly scaffolding protein Gp46 family protein n=1 Tax=Clostridioides difficile TaxID=1496 RepID=UPI00374F2292
MKDIENGKIKMDLQLLAGESSDVVTEQSVETSINESSSKSDLTNEQQEVNKTLSEEDIQALIEEKAQEKVNKVIGKEKSKLKATLAEKEKELESIKLSKMNEAERTEYQLEQMRSKIEEIEANSAKKDKELEQERLANNTKEVLVSREMPTKFTSMVMAGTDGDAEKILENIKNLQEWGKEWVEKQVNERLRSSAGTPKTSTIGGDSFTMEELKNMTPEQINANWDKIKGIKK